MNELLRRYRKACGYGKSVILSEIIEKVENTINYFVLKYSNVDMEKEDIRSELLIEVYKACDSFNVNSGANFKTYISRCFNNRCLKLYRDNRSGKKVMKVEGEVVMSLSLDLLKEECELVELSDVCSGYGEIELRMLLDSLGLDDDERILCNGYIRGYSKGELAKVLKVSNGTVTYKTNKIKSKIFGKLVSV